MPGPIRKTPTTLPTPVTPVASDETDDTGGAASQSVRAQKPPAPEPPAPELLAPERGDRLPRRLGRYQVQGILGEGRFGRVYDAFDDQLHRRVAIKVPAMGQVPLDVDVFLQEAQRLARLSHPGIVAVHDVGAEGQHCFIVSEFVPGPSLRGWLLERRPTWQQAAIIAARVADALAHAHSHATIHRDVKPANIILGENLSPVLIDFGLALAEKPPGESAPGDKSSIAWPGLVSGTPMYMSPEQARGAGHRIDSRTDIYSLGVVLYEMLCGRRPFQGDDVSEVLRQVSEDRPPPPRQLVPEIPEALERICARAMSRRISDRFGTAGDMAHQLREVLRRQGGVELPPATDRSVVPKFARSGEPPCPECGHSNSDSAAFCANCGVGLGERLATRLRGAGEADEARPAQAYEVVRRHVAILTCHCQLGPGGDPDEHHELLQILRQLSDEAAARYGGLVLASGGIPLQICFGFPTAWEDNAQRAVLCGRQILAEISQLGSRLAGADPVPPACVAIHSGEVVIEHATNDPATVLTVAGDVPAVARRMAEDAELGSIVISEPVRRLVGGEFAWQPLAESAPRKVKRRRQSAQPKRSSDASARAQSDLYLVVDRPPESVLTAAPPASLLVGRDAEFELLCRRWQQAREGLGQLVTVVGEVGIGKSRLVQELAGWFERQEAPAELLWMRCSPYHSSRVLHPITELLARRCQFTVGGTGGGVRVTANHMRTAGEKTPSASTLERDATTSKVDKLVRELERVQLADEQSVSLLAALLSIPLDDRFPALSLDVKQQTDRTYQLLIKWLERCAEIQPILLIVENLHWADQPTRQWCELLARRIVGRSLMAVLTFRPNMTPAWTLTTNQTQLALNRLTLEESKLLGRQTLDPTANDRPKIERIVALGDGVPLFIEQLAGLPDLQGDTNLGPTRLGTPSIGDATLGKTVLRDVELGDVELGNVELGDVEIGNVELGDVEIGDVEIGNVPPRISDLLTARIEPLITHPQIVHLAAALGPRFDARLLQAAAPQPSATIRRQLERLVDDGLLSQLGQWPDCQYQFRYRLLPEVICRGLLRRHRRLVHQRIVDVLVAKFPERVQQQPELLAYHQQCAGVAGETA